MYIIESVDSISRVGPKLTYIYYVIVQWLHESTDYTRNCTLTVATGTPFIVLLQQAFWLVHSVARAKPSIATVEADNSKHLENCLLFLQPSRCLTWSSLWIILEQVFQPISFYKSNCRQSFNMANILSELLLATSYTVSIYVVKLVVWV